MDNNHRVGRLKVECNRRMYKCVVSGLRKKDVKKEAESLSKNYMDIKMKKKGNEYFAYVDVRDIPRRRI